VSLLAYSFVCFIYFFIKSKLNYSLQISAVWSFYATCPSSMKSKGLKGASINGAKLHSFPLRSMFVYRFNLVGDVHKLYLSILNFLYSQFIIIFPSLMSNSQRFN
jgi:hypothetical protein